MSETSKFRPYLAAIIVNILILSFGMSFGWMSPAAAILQSSSPYLGDNRPLSDEIINWMSSLLLLGSVFGVFIWGVMIDRLGRKLIGYLISLPLIIGWIAVLFGPNHNWLLAGRFIMGISGSGATILLPLYASEISEDSYRGTTGSFPVLFFNLGVLVSFLIGAILSLQMFTILCSIFPVVNVFLIYFIPESPVYLWTKGKKKEAEESLLWLRSGNNVQVETELSMYKILLNSEKSKSRTPFSKLYEDKGTIKAMIISLVLFTVQHFNGRPMLLVYTTIILQKSKMDISYNVGTAIVGIIQFVSCIITLYLIDRINRKILVIVSFAGMFICLFTIGLFFYFLKEGEPSILPNWIPIIFICLHMLFHFISVSVPTVISIEILKPEIRPLAFSVSIFWGAFMLFFSVKIYSFLVSVAGMHGNFWFFALCCLATIIFTIVYIPETRGKSLIEIQRKLNDVKHTFPPNLENELDPNHEILLNKI